MNDYSAYRAVDFLQDEGFVEWLKNPESGDENSLQWENWRKENPGKKEEIEAARAILEVSMEEVELPASSKSEVWDRLQQSIIQKMQERQLKLEKSSREFRLNFLRVAASILMIVGLAGSISYFVRNDRLKNAVIIVENQRSSPSTVLLADGSSVVLYPNSSLSYPKNFKDNYRQVELTGKAFFEVAKDREQAFLVGSGHLFTKVLGTTFIVEDSPSSNEAAVSVVKGSVGVYSRLENEKDVKEGRVNGEIVSDRQALYFSEEALSFIRKDFTDHISLTYNFVDTPVLRVLEIFEAFYGIQILVDKRSLEGLSINASLIDMPFQKKIELICMAINYQYKFENNSVILTDKGPG